MATAAPHKRTYRMAARAEKAAATRERLLIAAWAHFSAQPYDGVHLGDIASDAGVSVQTLHTHFGAKDTLFVAAWNRRMVSEGPRRDSAPPGDVVAAVKVLYHSYDRDGDDV